MTHRSRNGGPPKTHKKNKAAGPNRKLHHPAPPPRPETPPPPPPSSDPLPPPEGPFNPPDTELLALIHRALHETLQADNFQESIQHIKGLLYEKKWLEVFCGSEGVLEAYAGRWVPSRAACFRELMGALVGEEVFEGKTKSLEEKLAEVDLEEDEDDVEEEEEKPEEEAAEPSQEEQSPTHNIISLGGGAGSELLAISALIRSTLLSRPVHHPTFTFTGIDIGNWHTVLSKLEHAVRVDWALDKEVLGVEYVKGDLLKSVGRSVEAEERKEDGKRDGDGERVEGVEAGPIDLEGILSNKPPKLITLFFTLAELLTQSRSSTISLLAFLTAHTAPGTLFLIADSASDISEFSLGAEGRKWPAWMIVDAMLTSKGKGWEKVRGEDSQWFRFEEGVGAGWACKLENTRYWYRLYRRV
ncbi:hypothetical protein L202_03992 [Cryptococcus amylolentus CBS 6039]|uniref:Cytoplasmic protein n=1 Tax=Cryptococcus amylolentus CBS 6039 TaxID=1295533 RepID=A0A1E3HPR9_9TREE|nr:hypothetical protein L202_03992 [Cryptococcus amylolentus CBS 6039]ODN78350.1 hypothetical protein L202_03992 [Cryptococcus amylolentus CBS 6039]